MEQLETLGLFIFHFIKNAVLILPAFTAILATALIPFALFFIFRKEELSREI